MRTTPQVAEPLHARQAVSILYKTRLPLLLVFNKTDVMAHDFAVAWMKDYEAFRAAIAADSTYAAELSRSLCLARIPNPCPLIPYLYSLLAR